MNEKFDLNRPLAIGSYTPTETFKGIPEHVAVMFEEDRTLVAVTGALDDDQNRDESIAYAVLFKAAPRLLETLKTCLIMAELQERRHGYTVENAKIAENIRFAIEEATTVPQS